MSLSNLAPRTARALVYVVEDNHAVAQLVAQVLNDFDFSTQTFTHGAAVLRRLQQEKPDLCVVDLGLPDTDGMVLVRQIRTICHAGVLILSARGHAVDRIMGLEQGGDDYMVKPFEPRELVARVRSILRRSTTPDAAAVQASRCARFAGWAFDCAANALRAADGTEHLLGTAEAQVLRVFLARPHQILTREQLMGQHDLSPLDRSIDVRISRLRRKLETDAQSPKLIKTVYGAGYLFTAPVSWS
jgi:DNA-binding response OmpR family regulator